MIRALFDRLVHVLTFIFWFFYHWAHPPVDMYRVWASSFQWRPTLHALYVDAHNLKSFDPGVDFATVVGCTTGVGFEVAAGLAATGLSVIAGMRGDAEHIERTAVEIRKRSQEIFAAHKLGENPAAFVPVVIPMTIEISDFSSCTRFSNNVARLLGCDGAAAAAAAATTTTTSRSSTASASASSSSPRRRSTSRGGRKSSAATATSAATTNSNSNTVNGKRKLLRIAHLNAAILMTDYEVTPQGFEAQAATNALGHFVVAENLLQSGVFGGKLGEKQEEQDDNDTDRDCRLIFTSSSGARFGDPLRGTLDSTKNGRLDPDSFCQFKMYGDSKALVAGYALLLQRRVIRAMLDGEGPRVSVRSFHPGCIASNIVKDSGMYAAQVFAFLQSTVGVAITMMVTPETASVYVLRMLLGVGGQLAAVPSLNKKQKKKLTEKQEQHIFEEEHKMVYSYIHQFETELLAHVLKDEVVLAKIKREVCSNLGEYFPNKKSVLE